MESRWSSDRLLPWMPGYVLFEVYACYLNEYLYRNTPNIFSTSAAACTCLDMEKKLSCAGVLTADVYALSNRIKQQAHYMSKSDLPSPVEAAGFLCIAEEAELMSELLACKSKNSVENDDFITEVLDDDSFNFSNKVRNTAFDILTTYRGPCSDSIVASLLGMKKEANLLRELLKLNRNRIDRFARLNICESLREHLLKFLIDINDCKFPEYDSNKKGKPEHAQTNHGGMVSYLESKKCLQSMTSRMELKDSKFVPPLDIILYRDLMETTWSWDRLLPWELGYVPFDFYLVYLNEYFYRNTPTDFNVHAAVSICLKMEEKLSRTGGLTADEVALSNSIKEKADYMIKSDPESPVAAAGFMCIAEEAEFMSELFECKTQNIVEDVFITELLGDKLSTDVRKIATDILSTYDGPCSDSIAASLLGMKKEANLLRELLKLNPKRMDSLAMLKSCKSQRQLLLQFLIDIHGSKFPQLVTS
ncbi:hypothetical protein ACQ4PT_060767 [Festuca glaucescens]